MQRSSSWVHTVSTPLSSSLKRQKKPIKRRKELNTARSIQSSASPRSFFKTIPVHYERRTQWTSYMKALISFSYINKVKMMQENLHRWLPWRECRPTHRGKTLSWSAMSSSQHPYPKQNNQVTNDQTQTLKEEGEGGRGKKEERIQSKETLART